METPLDRMDRLIKEKRKEMGIKTLIERAEEKEAQAIDIHTKEVTEPFTMVKNSFMRSTELSRDEKNVLILLKGCGEKKYPSYATLTKWSGLSDRSLTRLMKKLSERDILRIRKTTGRSNEYFINPKWMP